MAHGYLAKYAPEGVEVYSAGVEAHGVNPRAIQTMKEDGVDISHHTSNTMDEYTALDFDFVITVCDNAKERCPYFPGKAVKFHYNFPDPWRAKGSEGEISKVFADVRDMIKVYCREFVSAYL